MDCVCVLAPSYGDLRKSEKLSETKPPLARYVPVQELKFEMSFFSQNLLLCTLRQSYKVSKTNFIHEGFCLQIICSGQ